jgi:hypothetical protein
MSLSDNSSDDIRLLQQRGGAASSSRAPAPKTWASLALKAAAAVVGQLQYHPLRCGYALPIRLTPPSSSVLSLIAWLHSTRGYGLSPPAPAPAAPPSARTLLVISMDGFRADYLRSHAQYMPSINAFFRDGVKSKGIRPSFPSLTFPNHYTIATGLYPSAHGIVANSFINPNTAQRFSMGSGSLEPHWWGGEPLWVTARKAGLNAYVYFWPGSEVELHGYRPTQYKQYRPCLLHICPYGSHVYFAEWRANITIYSWIGTTTSNHTSLE